jgi:hypothetical protein
MQTKHLFSQIKTIKPCTMKYNSNCLNHHHHHYHYHHNQHQQQQKRQQGQINQFIKYIK